MRSSFQRARRWSRALAVVGSALLIGAVTARDGAAQLTPKRNIGAASGTSCPSQRTPSQPNAQRRAVARDAFAQGQEAAISGDNRAARDFFRRAAEEDATDPTTAYHLARAHEVLGEVTEAIREYCRFLSLAPRAADAAEARDRLTELGPRRSQSELATAQFRAGLLHYEGQRWRDAQVAFTRAISQAPDWPETHFNRALVLERLDQAEQAVADYQRYLELEPAATDREAVVRRIVSLRRQAMNPGSAFTRGLLLPGLGQHYTRRPVLGFLVLGAAGGAVALAFVPKDVDVVEIRTGTFIDPFGNEREYEYEFAYIDRQYPNRTAGIAAAAAISVLAAFEAYNHARSRTGAPPALRTTSSTRTAAPLLEYDWARDEGRVGVVVRF